MKLETTKLQTMLTRAIKGASFDKLIARSSMMSLEVKDNILTITTTDGSNYLYVKEHVEADDFYVVVGADIFTTLISKLTCSEVELELTSDSLTVMGNGIYHIGIELDADGSLAKLPDLRKDINKDAETETINLSVIQVVLDTASASLMSESLNVPCYTGYYFGDKIITTDSVQACGIDIRLFKRNMLISANMLTLVGLMTQESINVRYTDDTILFETDNIVVCGKLMPYLNDFAAEQISDLLADSYNQHCVIDKNELLAVIDRLSLFVGAYDNDLVRLEFANDRLNVTSMSSSATESINVKDVVSAVNIYTCYVNIKMLKAQLKAYNSNSVNVYYGNSGDNAIKLVDGNTTQVLALGDGV